MMRGYSRHPLYVGTSKSTATACRGRRGMRLWIAVRAATSCRMVFSGETENDAAICRCVTVVSTTHNTEDGSWTPPPQFSPPQAK